MGLRPSEKYHAFMQGWHDGAGVKAIRPDSAENLRTGAIYLEGYQAGRDAGKVAAMAAGERFGYKPLFFRPAEALKAKSE